MQYLQKSVAYKANIIAMLAAIDSENNNGLQHNSNEHTIRIIIYMYIYIKNKIINNSS